MPVVSGAAQRGGRAIKAYHKKHPKLSVIQFDAHGDLRATYEGSESATPAPCTLRGRRRAPGVDTQHFAGGAGSDPCQEPHGGAGA